MSILAQLFDGFSITDFMEKFFRLQPLARQGVSGRWQAWGSWESAAQILADPSADAFLARSAARWAGEEPVTYDLARRLHEEGYTLVVRHAERQHPEVAEAAAEFAEFFRSPIDVHLYCTPAAQHGFGWHYDAEDVFIVQTVGSKEYSLRKNTVNPWPLSDTMPANMRYEREISPLMKCRLEPGDWLYIPAGYWHLAQATEASISMAFGVLATSALDLFDFLRQELLGDLRWRQRLAIPGTTSAGETTSVEHSGLLQSLAADLQQRLTQPQFVERFWAHRAEFGQRAASHAAGLRNTHGEPDAQTAVSPADPHNPVKP